MGQNEAGHFCLCLGARLKEAAGGRQEAGGAEGEARGPLGQHAFAIERDTGKASAQGSARDFGAGKAGGLLGNARHMQVQPGSGLGDEEAEIFLAGQQRRDDVFQLWHRRDNRRAQDGAFFQGNQIMALAAMKADEDRLAGSARGISGAAARAGRGDPCFGHVRFQPACLQGTDDQVSLESGVRDRRHVLKRAAAADGEMAAGRGSALRRGRNEAFQFETVALPADLHDLSSQRERHGHPAFAFARAAIALRAGVIDGYCAQGGGRWGHRVS